MRPPRSWRTYTLASITRAMGNSGVTPADGQLGRLDVTVRRAPRDRHDAALTEDRQASSCLGDGHEVDRHAGRAASRHFPGVLLGVAVRARDLERAALGEAQRLAGLLGERGELRDRA